VNGQTVSLSLELSPVIHNRSERKFCLASISGKRFFCYFWFFVWMGLLVACGPKSDNNKSTGAAQESASGSEALTATEVQQIIAQAATKALELNFPVTIAVLDHEGFRLGVLRMAGALPTTTIQGGGSGGLEGFVAQAERAAISKAGSAALFGTQGFALSTRTTNFVLQERFPPGVDPAPGGPLLGVQFSQLPCSDVNRTGHPANQVGLPLGLSADPGGLPLYKNGIAVGGIGVEGNGIYTLDPDSTDEDTSFEEVVAAAGTMFFEAPSGIKADRIFIDGLRLPFANAEPPESQNTIPYGDFAASGTVIVVPINSPPSGFQPMVVGGVSGFVDPASSPVPFIGGTDGLLTAADVEQIIGQTAQQANRTRSALRNPIGLPARMSMTVVDTNGVILGMFRNIDAPVESWDISAQKARTANFFMRQDAGTILTANGFGSYVTALANDGIPLNGTIAFSVRAIGFLSYPIFPPGATRSFSFGPLSKPLGIWSIFNIGLQSDLLNVPNILAGTPPCTQLGPLGSNFAASGIQLFPQGVPLFKNGVHVGALGLSGDGADQDDIVPVIGSAGFEAPESIRSDQVEIRGVRLPFAVFPRNPNL
jgi:uncharacterized protein GlcG (DUF336 family)